MKCLQLSEVLLAKVQGHWTKVQVHRITVLGYVIVCDKSLPKSMKLMDINISVSCRQEAVVLYLILLDVIWVKVKVTGQIRSNFIFQYKYIFCYDIINTSCS